jgi:germination protein M
VLRTLLLGALGVLALAGCGDDSPSTTTTARDTVAARVYFVRDGKVWPVYREIASNGLPNRLLYEALQRGPTEGEKAQGFTTEVPSDGSETASKLAHAQITYTLTQSPTAPIAFPLGPVADFYAGRFRRADFEEQTPSVLVESPLPFEEVSSPLRATGTANTFEATFQYELLDGDGEVIDRHFVTATSGTGTRGTFDFTTKAVDDIAALRVFEDSAEDGSRIHEVEIPLSSS